MKYLLNILINHSRKLLRKSIFEKMLCKLVLIILLVAISVIQTSASSSGSSVLLFRPFHNEIMCHSDYGYEECDFKREIKCQKTQHLDYFCEAINPRGGSSRRLPDGFLVDCGERENSGCVIYLEHVKPRLSLEHVVQWSGHTWAEVSVLGAQVIGLLLIIFLLTNCVFPSSQTRKIIQPGKIRIINFIHS